MGAQARNARLEFLAFDPIAGTLKQAHRIIARLRTSHWSHLVALGPCANCLIYAYGKSPIAARKN
jgi:hypothetical protein